MDPESSEQSSLREPPSPRWWSPKRPWLPLALAVLLVGGLTALGLDMVEERRDLEAEVGEAEGRTEELRAHLKVERSRVAGQQRAVERESNIAKDCTDAARKGVAFLHQVVRSLGFLARFENTASQEAVEEGNQLVKEANRATDLCTGGLR